jgi:putative transposase
MGRGHRIDIADVPYHVINRANARARIFHADSDYADFEYLLNEMRETYDMRIIAYVIMPNHWHLLLYPKKDGDLSKALHWLCTSHAHRFRTRTDTIGHGHLYQGRYKSFAIQEDAHLLTVLKYIERNPVRAGLAERAEKWQWGSAHRRAEGSSKQKELLAALPVDFPADYLNWINTKEPAEELDKVRDSLEKNSAFGTIRI